ncbi:hypothetical protein [Thermus hydrothermalis]|uniref:hypothetical protein n=1 Tax=Thermus hydrothermalis TaxID=2908148 RepID=UPI001FA9EBAE|nr:hypothetical protein [Thermus hydrothermalis]
MRKVRLSQIDIDADPITQVVYEGDIEGLPPGEAKEYWEAVKAHYGEEYAWEYLKAKAPPMALIYRGWSLEVVEEGDEA